MRTDRKGTPGRRWIPLALLATALAAAALTIMPAESDSPTRPSYSARAYRNDSFVPIEIGSVIAQGKRDGDRCIFDERFGVGAVVDRGAFAPKISWELNEQCQAVISGIDSGDTTSPEMPAEGSSRNPVEVTVPPDGSGR